MNHKYKGQVGVRYSRKPDKITPLREGGEMDDLQSDHGTYNL